MGFELKAWLEQIQMGMYLKHFEDNGCTDWLAISLLTDEDLKEIQITMLGHRKKIMHSIAQKKQEAERVVVAEQPSRTQVKVHIAEDHFEIFTCGPDTTVANALPAILQAFDVQPQSLDYVALYVRSGDAVLPLANGDKIVEFVTKQQGDLWLLSCIGMPLFIETRIQQNVSQPLARSHSNMGSESSRNVNTNQANSSSSKSLYRTSEKSVQDFEALQKQKQMGFVANAAQQKNYASSFVPVNVRPVPQAFVAQAFQRTSFTPTAYQRTEFVHQPFTKSDYVPTQYQQGTITNIDVQKGHRGGFFGTGSRRYHTYATDSKGNRYEAHTKGHDGVNDVKQQFQRMEQTRMQQHQTQQQQAGQIHDQTQNALEQQHNQNQNSLEQQHNTNEQLNEIQHNKHEESLQQHHNEGEQLKENIFNKEQQDKLVQHKNKVAVDAIKNAAAGGALAAFTNSTIANVMAVTRGEKNAADAALQVGKDTVVGGAVGGVTGAVLASADRFADVQIGGGLITAAFITVDTILAIRKYWRKECTGQQCAEAIAKTFVVKTSGAIGAAAVAMGAAYALSFMTPFGLLVWAVPIVGSALGYTAGATAAEKLFNAATDRIYKWLDKPQMAVLKDAYDFLGVNSDDPNSVIERRFRELARIYHPDKGGDAEMMTKLSVYIEIIRCYREHRAYFEDRVLLLGMDETTRLTH